MAYYEPGIYRGKVTAQGFTKSKNKGTPYFYLTFQPFYIADEEGNLERLVENQYERSLDLYLTPNNMARVTERLAALGFKGEKLSELDPENESHHSFVDQEIDMICTANGKYEDWDLYGPDSRSMAVGPEALASKEVRELENLVGKEFKASMKQVAGTNGSPAPGNTNGSPAPGNTNDSPAPGKKKATKKPQAAVAVQDTNDDIPF